MDRPIWVRLAAVLERNPESTTVTLNRASAEEMLHEIKRLRAGGCARDQGLTQYCAEAAAKDAEITALKAEVERKDAALEKIDHGAIWGGLSRNKLADIARAALKGQP